ncbi:MAG: hypothetical protein BroJett015_37010 [Chloroflexota bacterium]|nr:hypothetical protein [Ardenticatenaceae bacterium]GIK58038.1 MAG: hypothetical protein BroJett015_37010 [Chloroflexota bacterium]
MFEVNGTYANRKGEYTVLEITPPVMLVRYSDGEEAELKISVQERIWQNIATEYEARAASKSARRKSAQGTNHFIKVVSTPSVDELTFPGWAERMVMAPLPGSTVTVKAGDRLIIYGLESRTFFAVITITGDSKSANPKDYFFTVNMDQVDFFPIDIDATVARPDNGVEVDTVELESQPRFRRLRLEAETYLPISEDDFELLAEALTEVTEEEDVDEEEVEEEFEEEEEE